MYDAIIVGGGPAGLNAALVLGRCRRTVLLCDSGSPRNAVSQRMSGFLTRDGIEPEEVRRIGRDQLAPYSCVELREVEVADAQGLEHGFEVTLADGRQERARKLLLATGLQNDLPPVAGADAFWGRGVHTCPYCDGWEVRDRPLAAFGHGEDAAGLALELLAWSSDVTLCTEGRAELRPKQRERLERNGIKLSEQRIEGLEGTECLERIVFAGGPSVPCGALFFMPGACSASPLIEKLGCEVTDKGVVETYAYLMTCVPGLYVAGDASRRVQFAVVAAAEGAMAAFAINTELLKEDLR